MPLKQHFVHLQMLHFDLCRAFSTQKAHFWLVGWVGCIPCCSASIPENQKKECWDFSRFTVLKCKLCTAVSHLLWGDLGRFLQDRALQWLENRLCPTLKTAMLCCWEKRTSVPRLMLPCLLSELCGYVRFGLGNIVCQGKSCWRASQWNPVSLQQKQKGFCVHCYLFLKYVAPLHHLSTKVCCRQDMLKNSMTF